MVNLSEDSFSAGGRHPDPERAIAHALELVRDGADAVDVGAAASNPRARAVAPAEEIRRLDPVVTALQRARRAGLGRLLRPSCSAGHSLAVSMSSTTRVAFRIRRCIPIGAFAVTSNRDACDPRHW
jgi:hypothetical protein